MSVVLPFGSNTLTTFVYEPFSYTISNPSPGTYTLTTSNTPGIPPGYLTNNGSNVVFATLSNTMDIGQEGFSITARDASGTVVGTSVNTVNINAGRFTDGSGGDYTGRIFTFYKNEPITPIPLQAPFAISTPTAVPTLPPGLTYTSNASNVYNITGTPIVTVPQSNYLFIGKGTGSNLGKIVTSQFGLSVSNERLLLNLSGSPVVSPMTVDTPITQRLVTAAFPPYPSGGALRYSWSGLPNGIVITDLSGTTQPGTFMPTDASYSLILKGTPTLAAANAFRDAGITSTSVTVTAVRTAPLPQISNTLTFAFAFGETVLFDTTVVPTLYVSDAIDLSSISYRAQTYFGSGSAISNIFSPNLRSDLSLAFVPSQGRAYLTGTPQLPIGTNTYTIRAINSNAVTRDLSSTITVSNDTITFAPLVDTCFNFVLSRPSSLALTGYYPSNIQFRASASSGNAVTYNGDDLAGTGLSLTPSNGIATITGTPTTVTPLKNVRITASNSTASAFVDISLAVLDDVFTFADVSSLRFIQNRAIDPVQFSATTLSGRSISSFTSSTIPSGLTLSTTGRLSGTPLIDTSGTFDIVATTGFSSGSNTYAYSLTPDSILFALDQLTYTYPAGEFVDIPIKAIAYSGNKVDNYAFSNFAQSYGLDINAFTGDITGTLTDSIPPNPLLPVLSNFAVTANSGGLTGNLPAQLTTINPVVSRSFLLTYGSNAISEQTQSAVYAIDNGVRGDSPLITELQESIDFQVKAITVDSNICMATNTYSSIFRSTDGVNFSKIDLNVPGIIPYTSYLANKTGTSTWWVSGYNAITCNAILIKSVDDGATWDVSNYTTIPNVYSRNSNGTAIGAPINNAYILGLPLRYKNGVLVVSGLGNGARSTNEGATWTPITVFAAETANFNFDSAEGNPWIAVGSDSYKSYDVYSTYASNTATIKYSLNQGQTWSNATGGFNFLGCEVVNTGGNNWLATGISYYSVPTPGYKYEVRKSTGGLVWELVDLSTNYIFGEPEGGKPVPQIPLGSLMWDGEHFNVMAYREQSPGTFVTERYVGNISAENWSAIPLTSTFTSNPRYPKITPPVYVRTGIPTLANFSFAAFPPGGPMFTSPQRSSYTFYQYATIQPIQFSATGTGVVYLFVDNNDLPAGLAFNPVTGILSGKSVNYGDDSFSVYAKDDIGVTRLDIQISTILPSIVRQQSGAGAWTSLVRQYTIVNAAQNSVNGRTLPAIEPLLGEFTRPEPPDSVSAAGNPNCRCPPVPAASSSQGPPSSPTLDFVNSSATYSSNTLKTVKVSWLPVRGATYYQVFLTDTRTGVASNSINITPTDYLSSLLFYEHSGPVSTTSYTFSNVNREHIGAFVFAYNSFGKSPFPTRHIFYDIVGLFGNPVFTPTTLHERRSEKAPYGTIDFVFIDDGTPYNLQTSVIYSKAISPV